MPMTTRKAVGRLAFAFALVAGAGLFLFWFLRRGEDTTVYLPTPPAQFAEPLAERYVKFSSFRVTVERIQARESRSFFSGWERAQDSPRGRVIVSFQQPNRIRIVQSELGDSERAIVAVCDGTSLWMREPGNTTPAPPSAADLFALVQLRGLAAVWRREWQEIPQILEAGCRASQEGPLVRLRFITQGIKRKDDAPGRSWLDIRVDPAANTMTGFESWSTRELAIATARHGEIERYSDLVANPSLAEDEFRLPDRASIGEEAPH